MKSPQIASDTDVRMDLDSWNSTDETLIRMMITPALCGTGSALGYVIHGDAITRRQYDYLNQLTNVMKAALLGVVARQTDGKWITSYSNVKSQSGDVNPFPDLVRYLDETQLDAMLTLQKANLGDFTIGNPINDSFSSGSPFTDGVDYTYKMQPCPNARLADESVPQLPDTPALYVFAIPNKIIANTVKRAVSWHVPFAVCMIIVSIITLRFTCRRIVVFYRRLTIFWQFPSFWTRCGN